MWCVSIGYVIRVFNSAEEAVVLTASKPQGRKNPTAVDIHMRKTERARLQELYSSLGTSGIEPVSLEMVSRNILIFSRKIRLF